VTVIVTVRLDEELSKKVEALKQAKGFVNATDLIRVLIVEAFNREGKERSQ